MFSIAIFKILF